MPARSSRSSAGMRGRSLPWRSPLTPGGWPPRAETARSRLWDVVHRRPVDHPPWDRRPVELHRVRARWPEAGHRCVRRHRADLGRRHRRGADRSPRGRGLAGLPGVLSRRPAAGDRGWRRHRPPVGRGSGSPTSRASGTQGPRRLPGLLARRPSAGHRWRTTAWCGSGTPTPGESSMPSGYRAASVASLAFAPDGRRLAAVGADGTAQTPGTRTPVVSCTPSESNRSALPPWQPPPTAGGLQSVRTTAPYGSGTPRPAPSCSPSAGTRARSGP